MKFLTRTMLVPILNSLGPTFDAHQVERRTLRRQPIEFAQELLRFQGCNDPLQQFNARFARWIDTEFRGHLTKTRKVRSPNLGGEDSSNQEWRKVSSTPIT